MLASTTSTGLRRWWRAIAVNGITENAILVAGERKQTLSKAVQAGYWRSDFHET